MTLSAVAGAHHPPDDRLRVMVVDDSAVVRGLVARLLDADPALRVVASVSNGQAALTVLPKVEPDVVILDVEMPVMDGLTALPQLIAARPGLPVLMSSTLTVKGAEISLRAMAAGAADCVAKPSAGIGAAEGFKRDLLEKVKALGSAARRRREVRVPAQPVRREVVRPAPAAAPVIIRPASPAKAGAFDIVAIGSSTGGPQALFAILDGIGSRLSLPILITQHMPPTFTAILAQHLAKVSGAKAAEAQDGEPVVARRIYVAPGDQHMTVAADGPAKVIRLTQTPPENFCRPAVDPMLRSIAKVYGARTLAIILTGMGRDGAAGAAVIAGAGGTVVAQDEATSVVWGMPGATVQATRCDAVLPLAEIGEYLRRVATGAQP
jgi:two-component system chemotaxis response regulator CheB